MAKIVIDARIINSTTGRYIERLLAYLQDIDTVNEYVVLVLRKDINYWKPKNKNFSIKVADYKNYSFAEQIGFLWFLYRLKANLVHFCMPQQPILYFKSSITSIHDLTLLKVYNSDKNWLVYHFKQLIGKFVFWWVARKSQFILTISDFSKNEILRRYRISPLKVIRTYLAADGLSIKSKIYKTPYKKYILYVGQQSDYKNIRRLIEAHQLLLSSHPNLGLILVGSKSLLTKNNELWVKNNGYKNVVFTGFVDDDQLSWLYKNCEAYVFPSLMEGFGLPGLEAMTQGAPVVSSDATCLPEVYDNAAHYFDPKDVKDMAKKIGEVLENDELRSTLIKNGNQQIKKYSWQKTAQETLDVYKKALESNKDS